MHTTTTITTITTTTTTTGHVGLIGLPGSTHGGSGRRSADRSNNYHHHHHGQGHEEICGREQLPSRSQESHMVDQQQRLQYVCHSMRRLDATVYAEWFPTMRVLNAMFCFDIRI